MQISMSSLEKKIIITIFLLGVGFYGGVKFTDVKMVAKDKHLQETIAKYDDKIKERDKKIATLKETEVKSTEQARIAKEQADKAHITANNAEAKYRKLVAQLHPNNPSENTTPPSVDDIVKDCSEALDAKNVEIAHLNVTVSNCFDAKAAADKIIDEEIANRKDQDAKFKAVQDINDNLRARLESERRRKWLYILGGVVTGYAASRYIHIGKTP